jgi:hypothetical protein
MTNVFLRLFQREKGEKIKKEKRIKKKRWKKNIYDFFFDKLLNRVVRYLNNFEL